MIFQQRDPFSQAQQRNSVSRQAPRETQNPLAPNLFYLEDVNVQFSEVHALKNIALKISPGEILFVTGPSGAGKTTLLRVLAGAISPTHGRILLPDPSRLFTSQVFQDLRLISEQTCYANLLMAYDPQHYSGGKREFQDDLNELCRFFGIQDRLKHKISQANGGLKQKIAIIRALLARPDVFIADEPTSSLDIDNSKKLFELLNLYNTKRGMTVIWASHSSELVKRFSGRIVHMQAGKIVYSGHACFI